VPHGASQWGPLTVVLRSHAVGKLRGTAAGRVGWLQYRPDLCPVRPPGPSCPSICKGWAAVSRSLRQLVKKENQIIRSNLHLEVYQNSSPKILIAEELLQQIFLKHNLLPLARQTPGYLTDLPLLEPAANRSHSGHVAAQGTPMLQQIWYCLK